MGSPNQPTPFKEYLSLPSRGKVAVLWRLCRDNRVPLPAKFLPPLVIVYLVTPVDIVPDFIPVLGQLDDLVVILLGLGLFFRLCPREVVREQVQRWRAEHERSDS